MWKSRGVSADIKGVRQPKEPLSSPEPSVKSGSIHGCKPLVTDFQNKMTFVSSVGPALLALHSTTLSELRTKSLAPLVAVPTSVEKQ